MRVERCPSCGARYDVSSLAEGGTFACRRCAASVVVGAGIGEVRRRLRPGLLVTGVIMLASLFLYANPWFGAKAANWPWQHFAQSTSLSRKADLLLWVVVGVLAVVLGTGRGGRARCTWLLPPLLLLVVRCYGEGAAFTAIHRNEPTLAWFLAVSLVGAAAALLATPSAEGRAGARYLAAIGAVGAVAAYAVTFVESGHSLLWHNLQGIESAWRFAFLGSEHEPETVSALWKQWWGQVLPILCLSLATVLALALAAIPPGRKGAWVRGTAWAIWALLLLRWVVPLGATFVYDRKLLFAPGGLPGSAQLIGRTIFDSGLGLWLITSFALAALLRERGRAAGAAAPTPAWEDAGLPLPEEVS